MIAAMVAGQSFSVCPVCNTVHRVQGGRHEAVTLRSLIDQLEQMLPDEYRALVAGWRGRPRTLRRQYPDGTRPRILFTMEKPPEGLDPALN